MGGLLAFRVGNFDTTAEREQFRFLCERLKAHYEDSNEFCATSRGLANNTILGRYALPEEIANMAVILVSGLGNTILGDIVYMTGGSALVSYEDMDYHF